LRGFHNSIFTGAGSEMGKIRISNNIRKLRFNNDEMTQQDLAKKTDVTRQTIMAVESGKYSPSLELAFRIAHVFGLPLQEVFTCIIEDDTDPKEASK
jgi:putative transcriptional regulator